jgi:hypothetical protein
VVALRGLILFSRLKGGVLNPLGTNKEGPFYSFSFLPFLLFQRCGLFFFRFIVILSFLKVKKVNAGDPHMEVPVLFLPF